MTSHGEARKMRIGHSRPGYYSSVAWRWSLESGLRSKDSRVVRRRVVGKVPIEATRWRPILLQARFWSSGGRGDSPTDCRKLSGLFCRCQTLCPPLPPRWSSRTDYPDTPLWDVYAAPLFPGRARSVSWILTHTPWRFQARK